MSAQLQRDVSDAQVQAIKMLVQPHFLFNTLHAVNVLIEKEPAAATRMVTRLGDLLRHTLTRATVVEVPLGTELEVLRLYLEIEQTRFRDRLTVRIDAPRRNARRVGARPDPAAAGGERDQARHPERHRRREHRGDGVAAPARRS